MKKTMILSGIAWLFAVATGIMAIFWLLREVEWLQFQRPEDMVTPMLAMAFVSLSIGIYQKGTKE